MDGTPLSDGLGRIRDYVAKEDVTSRIQFRIDLGGNWIWSDGKESVQVGFSSDMTGFDVTYQVDGKAVEVRYFPLETPNFSVESRVGSHVLRTLHSGALPRKA
jgi:hypothetical protein